MKEGKRISSMIHPSGDDILVSYRTGHMVQVEGGKIKKIFTSDNYHEIAWQRKAWEEAEQLEEIKEEQAEAETTRTFYHDQAAEVAKGLLNNIADQKK